MKTFADILEARRAPQPANDWSKIEKRVNAAFSDIERHMKQIGPLIAVMEDTDDTMINGHISGFRAALKRAETELQKSKSQFRKYAKE